ncbi:MAG: hypothetical protein ACRD3D_08510 [Terriglobia bacterium]
MTLLDAKPVKLKRGILKYVPLPVLILIIAIVAAIVAYEFWDYPEERAVSHFLATVQQGNVAKAYKLWKPGPYYPYREFLNGWGPKGDFGKIRKFEIVHAKSEGYGTVRVWVVINGRLNSLMVDRKTKSLSYPPPD